MLIDDVQKHYEADTLKYIEYNTNFIGFDGDCINYYLDAKTGMYTDLGFCIDDLQCYARNWEDVVNYYCKQNDCNFDGWELKAKKDYQLLQTVLAIYNWINTPVKLCLNSEGD